MLEGKEGWERSLLFGTFLTPPSTPLKEVSEVLLLSFLTPPKEVLRKDHNKVLEANPFYFLTKKKHLLTYPLDMSCLFVRKEKIYPKDMLVGDVSAALFDVFFFRKRSNLLTPIFFSGVRDGC